MTDDPRVLLFGDAVPVEPRRRRRSWPWLLAVAVVVVLVVGAALFVQSIARQAAEDLIRQQLVSRLGLSADQRVEVELSEPFLIQLVAGSIGEARVSADDVRIEGLMGDLAVVLRDVDIWGEHRMSRGTAELKMDTPQLRSLLANVDGFPADAAGLAAPNVTLSTDLRFLGASFPLGVALTPSAANGEILLTPASLRLGGAVVTADDIRSRFGTIADPVLRAWDICIADRLPTGVLLESVDVPGDVLVATLGIDGDILADPALLERGVCPGG